MDELQVGGVNRVSVQQPLAGYEALPAGTVFDHSFRLCQASELEVGFFLSVLRSFALDPVIGAHAAHGAGLIGGSWNAMVRTDTATAFDRSEEHTSELQSLMRISYAVFCLKKKQNIRIINIHT